MEIVLPNNFASRELKLPTGDFASRAVKPYERNFAGKVVKVRGSFGDKDQ